MSENMAGVKVAVIYRNDDAYRRVSVILFVKEAASKGIEVVYEGTFTKRFFDGLLRSVDRFQTGGRRHDILPSHLLSARFRYPETGKRYGDMSRRSFGVDGMDGYSYP